VSQTPARYYCQPDLTRQRQTERDPNNPSPCRDEDRPFSQICGQDLPEFFPTPLEVLRPEFVSTRYGDPGYAQLNLQCPPEIARGAEDESEMGVFHDLYQPQRTANLQARLDEFTPVTMKSAILFAT
jgi:hypothetical protein